MAPSVAPRMPIFPPGAPGLGQQFLYGQAPPAIIPPQVSTLHYLLHILFISSTRFRFDCCICCLLIQNDGNHFFIID